MSVDTPKRRAWMWAVGAVAGTVAAAAAVWASPAPTWIRNRIAPPDLVHVGVDRDRSRCNSYAFETPIADTGAPPRLEAGTASGTDTTWGDWALRQNAAEVGETRISVTVYGDARHSVTVTGLSFAVERKLPAAIASVATVGDCPTRTAGRYLVVDLDRTPATVVEASPGLQLPFTLTGGSPPATLEIIARSKQYASWTASLAWTSSGGLSQVETIDSDGIPFRTAGATGVKVYEPKGGGWQEIKPRP